MRIAISLAVLTLTLIATEIAAGTAGAIGAAQDQPARADNVRFEVAEGGVVRVFYDLVADNPQQLVDVRLMVSRDGGRTFDLTARTVSGDVGPAVASGTGKQITWEAARDVERVDAALLRFRVVVTTIGITQEPRRFWGIVASFVPDSRVPSSLSKPLFNAQAADLRGAEFRIGIVRGRSQGRDWGISVVRRRLKSGSSIVRGGYDLTSSDPLARTSYLVTESIWATGAEMHAFFPFVRLGRRAQLGVVFAAGMSTDYDGDVERRTEGTIYATNPSAGGSLRTVPVGPGFVYTYQGPAIAVAPGQTSATDRVAARLLRVNGWDIDAQLLARIELAGSIALGRQAKLRMSGGFNFPNTAVFGIDIARFFGAP
jgi:hypothetical protein